MVKLTIDGKAIESKEGKTIIQAASDNNIVIPTLCYNEELTPTGSCRVCVVEVIADGVSTLVSSCDTPVKDGIEVYTNSENAIKARKYAIQMLYSQNSDAPAIKALAGKYNITEKLPVEESECIGCGRCYKVCSEVVERKCIDMSVGGLSNMNEKLSVKWNFDNCIACGACAYVCPTHAVSIHDEDGVRTMITPNAKREFSMKKCSECGKYYAPNVQIEWMKEKTGLPDDKFDRCMDCR